MTQSAKNIALSLLFCTLAACAGGKDWPNLSDPLPDPADRDRVRFEAAPAEPVTPATNAPATQAEAAVVVEEVSTALPLELKAYRLALTAFDGAADDEARKDSWLDAQLKLTRLSRTLSRLDPLTDGQPNSQPDSAEPYRRAAELKAFYEPLVVEERQRLFRLSR